MKLSEAIRLGAMLRPRQAFRVLFDKDTNATCALGAAAEAVGVLDTSIDGGGYKGALSARTRNEWTRLVKRDVACPACRWRFTRVDDALVHLNNEHRWTRERIADWVETIEAKATVAAAEPDRSKDAQAVLSAATTKGQLNG